jgi:hypothetical protein
MSIPPPSVSSVKLAWAVAWAAFWTGFPFKVVAALLLLAMQVHPWEDTGLVALVALSVPIDLWAVGLTARTVFLERLSLEVKGPVGLPVWGQGAALGVVMLGVGYYVVGATVGVGKSVAAAIIGVIKRIYPKLPIAEQITIELLLWTIPVVLVMVGLGLVWLQLFGWRIKAFLAAHGEMSPAGLPERVRSWDQARVPSDPWLVLGSLAGVAFLLTVAFWVFLPATTPHPHPDYPLTEVAKPKKPVKPDELLKKTETTLAKAEAILTTLEEEKKKESKGTKKPERKGK